MSPEEFIEKATTAAREARDKGAPISVPIAVAQAALESGFGRSQLAREANNLGGVKAGSSWTGPVIELPTREYRAEDGTWYSTVARWRRYPDWASYFSDYGDLIQRVYPQSAAVKDDPRAFLEGLVSGHLKYATDPRYVEKVWTLVEQHDLLEPEYENPLLPVTSLHLVQTDGTIIQYALDRERPARIVNGKLYANLR